MRVTYELKILVTISGAAQFQAQVINAISAIVIRNVNNYKLNYAHTLVKHNGRAPGINFINILKAAFVPAELH